MTRAIIFVPSDAFEQHAARCLQYCEDRGYEFQGIIFGDWSAVQRMLDNDQATVAIVDIAEHLDPNRKPRIEVIADHPASSRWEQRTRLIRRGEAD